jgi:hypothetical protein
VSLTIIRAEYNNKLMDLLYAIDRENKEDKGYKVGLYGFTGTSEGDKTICSASPISSNYSGRKHTVFALDDEPISNIVLLGDYTGLGFTGSGTWFILNCQEIGNKELVLICHDLQ